MAKKRTVVDVLSAMNRNELKVFYQPKFDATTNRVKSAEALVRWIQADGHTIMPDEFLPAMEQSDAITLVDWFKTK